MAHQAEDMADHLAMIRLIKSVYSCYSTRLNQLLTPIGLTMAQCEILSYLYDRIPTPVGTGELLEALQIAAPSLSHTLKNLERNGYVHYLKSASVQCDQGDSRKKLICLAPKAIEIQDQLTKVLLDFESIVFYQIADEDWLEVQAILQKIKQNMTDI